MMPINMWGRLVPTTVRAGLRRSTTAWSARTAPKRLKIHLLAAGATNLEIPRQFGHVKRRTFALDAHSPSIWELANQLRTVDIKGAREPVVDAIQDIVIHPGSTDDREAQALDIIQSNVLESLLHLLEDECLADFHVPTYLTLIKLTTEPLISQELVRLNAPRTIATYLSHADPRLQIAACLTLGNLALESTSQLAMASNDVVDPLFGVLASPHEAIQRAAMTTIATIAGMHRGRHQLCDVDRILTLCGLLPSDHSDELRSAVAFALGNILSEHDTAAQDALRESGALPELILLVSTVYPDDVCASAAWAIHHGVHQNHESQTMVAEAGGIPLLFQHVFADDETLQTNALLALESTITGHADNTESFHNNKDAVQLLTILRENAMEDDLNPTALRALDALLQQIR